MSISNQLKSVIRELTPILAGLKIAAILLTWIGVGSAASWVIEYWYPFTRNVWDYVCKLISIPNLSLEVKDTLTAFIFFLPLGVNALMVKLKGESESVSGSLRVIAGSLAAFFLIVIAKEGILHLNMWDGFEMTSYEEGFSIMFLWLMLILGGFGYSFYFVGEFSHRMKLERKVYTQGGSDFKFDRIIKRRNRWEKVSLIVYGSIVSLLLVILSDDWYRPVAIIGLVIASIGCIKESLKHTPSKLLLVAGSTTSFIFAAFFYEVILIAHEKVESTVGNSVDGFLIVNIG